MGTSQKTVDFLCTALLPLELRARPMFGEYALYLGEKLVALLCDEQLFVKLTPAGATFLDESHLCPPYPGSKPALRVPDERWREKAWLTALLVATEQALPAPKPKKPKAAKAPPPAKAAKAAGTPRPG